MARFCTKCGRPLKEGEVCNCTAQNSGNAQNAGGQQRQAGAQQHYQQGGQQNYQQSQQGGRQNYQQGQQYYQQSQQGGQQYYQQGQQGGQQHYQQGQQGGMTKEAEWLNRQKDVIMSGTKSMFSEIGPIIKSPVSRVKQLASSNSGMVGIEFIVAKTIIAVIVMIIALLVMQGKIDDLTGGFADVDMPYFKVIMTTLLMTAGVDFLEALIMKAITGAFNGNTNYNAMLNVLGARAIFDTIVLVIVMFLMLLSLKFSLIVYALFSPIIVYIQFAAYRGCVRMDENKKPYAYFIAKVCISIVGALIVYMMFKDTIDAFMDAFDALEGLLNGELF